MMRFKKVIFLSQEKFSPFRFFSGKLGIFFVLFFGLFFLPACSKQRDLRDWMAENGKAKVLSTTAQIGDLVAFIAADRVDRWVLIQGDLDPHSYEMVKGDGEKLARADLIFYNGLGLEHGASLASFLGSHPRAVAIGEKIREADPARILQRNGVADPHIWMDISLWQQGIEPIVKSLSQIDPEGAPAYQRRGEQLALQMQKVHQEMQEELRKIPAERRYLVTSHDAFHYFARSYLAEPGEADWQGRLAAPEGLAPEGQLSPRDIQTVIDYLQTKKVAVIFPESNVSRDSLNKIASASVELGWTVAVCKEPLYADAMSGLSYLDMMRKNGDTIAKYLCNTQ